jgi:hypothetical protein
MKSNPIEDPETLRSYLLGTLSADDADAVEHRLLEDNELFELAEAVEGDLLAACARGDLSPGDRDRVLRRLAVSPRGKSRLAVAEGLNALANGATATKAMRTAVVVPFLQRKPQRQAPSFRFAATAAGLLLVLFGSLRLAMQTARPGAAVIARNQVTAAARHAEARKPAPTEPAAHGSAIRTAVFQLALAVTRSAQESTLLTIPAGTRLVEIQLPLSEGEPFSSYRAQVLDNTSDTEIWQGDLSPRPGKTGPMVVVSLPAAKLPQGSYRIELRGVGADGVLEPVGFPSFDVRTH